MLTSPLRIAVLLSGSGRTLQNFIDERAGGRLDVEIPLVIGSRPGLAGIDRAAAAGLASYVVHRKSFNDVGEFSRRIFALCDEANVGLVCLAGWLCLLEVPQRYLGRIMNV